MCVTAFMGLAAWPFSTWLKARAVAAEAIEAAVPLPRTREIMPLPSNRHTYLPAHQLRLLPADLEVAALAVPVGQDPALERSAVELHSVPPGPMRMAVDQARRAGPAQRLAHGVVVDVHDLGRLGLDHFLALLAQA